MNTGRVAALIGARVIIAQVVVWRARDAGLDASYQVIPDYTLPFLGETALSTIVAGVIGIFVVGAIVVLIGRGMRAKA